jgi:hypothetical protein
MQSGLPLMPFPLLRSMVFFRVWPSLRKIQKAAWRTRPFRLHQRALPMMRALVVRCLFLLLCELKIEIIIMFLALKERNLLEQNSRNDSSPEWVELVFWG